MVVNFRDVETCSRQKIKLHLSILFTWPLVLQTKGLRSKRRNSPYMFQVVHCKICSIVLKRI